MSQNIVIPAPLRGAAPSTKRRRREAERPRDARTTYRMGSALARRVMNGDTHVAAEAEQHLWVALDAGVEEAALDLSVLFVLHGGRVREAVDLLIRASAYRVSGAKEMLRILTGENEPARQSA